MDVNRPPVIFTGFDVDGFREYLFREFSDAFHFMERFDGEISMGQYGITVTI